MRPTRDVRRLWLVGTVALTAVAFAATILGAPPAAGSPAPALTWLVFAGSSPHVAATGWFAWLPPVRGYARARPGRYLVAPAALVGGTAVVAAVLAPEQFQWLLLGFFAWQFVHFQKQNLGLAAVAGVRVVDGALTTAERRALVVAGGAGTAGLVAKPALLGLAIRPPLGWLFVPAGLVLVAAVVFGLALVARRERARRPAGFTVVYLGSLVFFVPVFVFSAPYAAVGGLIVAHGLQYLLLMALVAGGEQSTERRVVSLAMFVNIAALGGIALEVASHLHDGAPAARAVYGAYLGVVMAHFVVDAGLWRLRDRFPREMLTARVPYLVARDG